MHRLWLVSSVLVCAATLSTTTPAQVLPDSAAFVTRLGADTLAVERFVRTDSSLRAEALLRMPETRRWHYWLEFDDEGRLVKYQAIEREPTAEADAPPISVRTVTAVDGKLMMEAGEETQEVEAAPTAVPFMETLHWPFELMLVRAYASADDEVSQDMFSGPRGATYRVARLGADSMDVIHPYRGTMQVRVDEHGRLQHLDAGQTTRKLTVDRTDWIDLDPLARHFAALDEAGRSVGRLSTRGTETDQVHGATINVDYGRPAKRGRTIFGGIVPWNEVWRTGADADTRFETDRDLQIGDLDVPAGTYSLFSIPAPDGGQLIINRQTGQGGTSYDESMDLGRVPFQRNTLPEPVERFTIDVTEEEGGMLRLQWDTTELAVPIKVKP